MKYGVEMRIGLQTRNVLLDTREECADFLCAIRDATADDAGWWEDMTLACGTGISVNRITGETCDVMVFGMYQNPREAIMHEIATAIFGDE